MTPSEGPDADLLTHAALTTLRLRASQQVLQTGLAQRGRPNEDIDHIITSAADRDRLTGPSLDTTALTVATSEKVQARLGGWPEPTSGTTPSAQPTPGPPNNRDAPGQILWVCGPKAVGKSTVGWSLYQLVSRSGVPTAFVDLQQVGFLRPDTADTEEGHRLKARDLATIWKSFRGAGARFLVIVGPIHSVDDITIYRAELPEVTITLCRLRGGRDQLADRLS